MLAILWLTGCAGPTHLLVKEDSALFVGGKLVHDRGESNHLVLEAQNRRYEARGFVVERQSNLAELRKCYYGVNPKHWDRIFWPRRRSCGLFYQDDSHIRRRG